MGFDITIVGGGLVGASLACALKDQKLKIALIDKLPYVLNPPQNLEARALALSFTSMQCLKIMEVWPKIEEEVSPILEVHVSKKNHFGLTRIKARELKLPALGYVVNADNLNNALNETVKTISSVTTFRPDEIIELKKGENAWNLQLSSQKTLTTKLLVVADGAESPLRKHQGIGIQIKNHHQTAFVTNIELNQSHKNVAYERFTSTGSIAFLPFGKSETQVKCVWIVPTEEAKSIESLSELEFLKAIQDIFGYRLGRLIRSGKRVVYPLRTISSDSLYNVRLVLIGNAANTLNPIAAQGFNMGLRDAALLAEMLVAAHQKEEDIGSIDLLRTYANLRVTDHQSVRQLCDRLAEPNVMQWLGIAACEWASPFKRLIANWGVGRQQVLPKLCRGVRLPS